jgi:hypothetical protein
MQRCNIRKSYGKEIASKGFENEYIRAPIIEAGNIQQNCFAVLEHSISASRD